MHIFTSQVGQVSPFLIGTSITEMKCEVGPSLMQVQPKERIQLCAALRTFCKVQDTWTPVMSLTLHQCGATNYWNFLKSVMWKSNINKNWAVIFRENFFPPQDASSFLKIFVGRKKEPLPTNKEKKLNSINGNMECSSAFWWNRQLFAPAVSQWTLCNAFSLSFWGFSENLKSASIPGKWNQGGLYVRVKEESKYIFKAHEMTLNLIFIFGNCLFLHSNAKVI